MGNIERHRTPRIGWLRAAVMGADDGIVSAARLVLGVAALLGGCATPTGTQLDRAHGRIYDAVQRAVVATDQRFARAERDLLPVPAAQFRVGFDMAAFDRRGGVALEDNLDLSMTLHLPNIEQRARIFVTGDDLSEGLSRVVQEKENAVRIGAQLPIRDKYRFDIGVRAAIWPSAFAALSWSTEVGTGAGRLIPFAKAYAETGRGVGAAAGVTLDHYRGHWLWRSSSAADWRRDRNAAVWTQAFAVVRVEEEIDDTRLASLPRLRDVARGYGLRIAASSPDTRSSSVGLYSATLLFKGRLRGSWLYWFAGPEVRWERDTGWNPDYGLRFGIDVLFREGAGTSVD